MARLFYQVMQDNLGNLLFGVSGTMRLAGEGALATIYGDEALTVILPNPMTNHPSFASFKCYLGAGSFDFYMAKAGYTFETLTGVPGQGALGTMAEQDANAVAITGGQAQLTQLGLGIAPQSGFALYVQGPSTLVGNVSMQSGSLAIGGAADGIHLVVAEGRVKTRGMTVVNLSGNDVSALYTNLAAAGGTNRYAIHCEGDAASRLGGGLAVIGAITGSTTLRIDGATCLGGAPDPLVKQTIYYDKSTTYGMRLQQQVSDSGVGEPLILSNIAGVAIGGIATTATATAYNTASDARLKRAITALTGAVGVVQALRPVAFRWRSNDESGHGFIASEVQQVVDGVITGDADAMNEDGSVRPQQIDMAKLVPWLTAALQDTLAQVQALAARVASLETQLGV